VFGGIVLIPILGLFLLSDGETLASGIIQLVSTKETSAEARALVADLNDMLRHYIRAKVILAVLSLVFCSVVMLLLRYPHALALGLLAGALEFIPVAGWITALATITAVGIATHSHWIWMAALLGLWRMVMDYAIAPRVVGHELEMHPLLAIFTVMVGGAVGGIVGIYLSVPLVAALRVIMAQALLVTIGEGKQNSKGHEPHPHCECIGAAGMQRVLVCGLPKEETRLGHRDGGSDLRCCFFSRGCRCVLGESGRLFRSNPSRPSSPVPFFGTVKNDR